jgi:glycosyltransferase involved in cell wall biosynthesis
MIDKYYFVKGGAERYMFELAKVLEANGHEVIPFSMKHPQNFETPYKEYFVENIEYNGVSAFSKATTALKATARMIYYWEARKRLERLLADLAPDIAHLHMIDHQLSPSILHSLKKFGVPVIQTVHQYKLVCPNYKLYNPRTGEICEKCLSGNFRHPLFERCHKDSALASLMIALESKVHRLTEIYEKNVDIFHVPSHFMGSKFEQAGIARGKIRHMFYSIEMQKFTPSKVPGDYLLYFGRLSKEKGILTLLKAAKSFSGAPLLVVGDGPQEAELKKYAQQNNLSQVKFLGVKSGAELEALVKNSRAVIVPSEWFDNSPLVIYESFAYGRPVIGAQMGGITELIDDGETGYLFPAGDVGRLVEKMRLLWESPQRARAFGKAARAKAEREFDPQTHYNRIYDWYVELTSRRQPILDTINN